MSIEENKTIMRRWAEELFTDANYDVADEIIHPDRIFYHRSNPPKDARAVGPEGDKQMVREFREMYPDLRRTVVDLVAEGDKVVLYSTITGTHTGMGKDGFAPTGEAMEVPGVNCWLIEDGKILEPLWGYWNLPAVYQQLARAAVRLFFKKVWNGGDLEAADQYIAPDYVRHDPAAPEDVQGINGFKEVVSMYRTAFPDLHLAIDDIIAEGGEKIAIRWSGSGSHEGELTGVPPTGKQVKSSGHTFLRLVKGKIVEEWVQWDSLGLLQQIGAMPTKE